jgi:hypothetical protein
MKIFQVFLIGLCCWATNVSAQDEAAIIGVIQELFDGMREANTDRMRATFHPEAQNLRSVFEREGETMMRSVPVDSFLAAVARPHDEIYDEKIWSYDIQIDGPLANAWTEYSFFLGERFLHCGFNKFELIKQDGNWKIYQITDTRKKTNCKMQATDLDTELHQLLDNWHQAAAVADADAFFGAMAEDGIYLGTDASERWLRDELRTWAKSAFERETAWAFEPIDRELYFAADQKMAWFEENLNTWMGICRGSGVLKYYQEEGWKIQHYNLAVTVPNEKIQAFISIMQDKK